MPVGRQDSTEQERGGAANFASEVRCLLRRVVTGHDPLGQSFFVRDDVPEEPFPGDFEFWSTQRPSAPGDEIAAATMRAALLLPPPAGTLCRFITIPPDGMVRAIFDGNEAFAAYSKGAEHIPDAQHPFKHRTETIDYVIVLKGKIDLILDCGRKSLEPFCVVVQRGTAHAWANPHAVPALLAVVLIDARQAPA